MLFRSGDLYDLSSLSGNRTGILVADLRGHGVSAALSTTWLSAMLQEVGEFARHPQAYIRALNARLTRPGTDGTFATACYAVYDAGAGRLRYSIAGHPHPLHYHAATGNVTELNGHGMPFGIEPRQAYGEDSAELDPRDAVLIYTDGISETFDAEGAPLGTGGLTDVFRETLDDGSEAEGIYQRVLGRSGETDLDDDVTLVLLRRK